MGLAMALNLQKRLSATGSRSLHYTNRTISRGSPLQEVGGVPCTSVQEVVETSDIVFISVWTLHQPLYQRREVYLTSSG